MDQRADEADVVAGEPMHGGGGGLRRDTLALEGHAYFPSHVARRAVGGNGRLYDSDRPVHRSDPNDPVELQVAAVRRVADGQSLVASTELIEHEWSPAGEAQALGDDGRW